MQDEGAAVETQLTNPQRRVVEHGTGAMLVTGRAGSGRSEALAARLARLASAGTAPDRILVLTRSRAGATHLRARAAALIELPYEELWISTYEVAAERLLREHALEAGLDPFFTRCELPTGSPCCSTGSMPCRSAGTRSAATPPGSWPLSSVASTP
jgi:hypothetical protein